MSSSPTSPRTTRRAIALAAKSPTTSSRPTPSSPVVRALSYAAVSLYLRGVDVDVAPSLEEPPVNHHTEMPTTTTTKIAPRKRKRAHTTRPSAPELRDDGPPKLSCATCKKPIPHNGEHVQLRPCACDVCHNCLLNAHAQRGTSPLSCPACSNDVTAHQLYNFRVPNGNVVDYYNFNTQVKGAISKEEFERILDKPYGPRRNAHTGEIFQGEHRRDEFLMWDDGRVSCGCCGGKSIMKRDIVQHITGSAHQSNKKGFDVASFMKEKLVVPVVKCHSEVKKENPSISIKGTTLAQKRAKYVNDNTQVKGAISQEDFEIMLDKPYGPRKNAHTGEIFQEEHRRGEYLMWEDGKVSCGCCGGKSIMKRDIVQHITGAAHQANKKGEAERQRLSQAAMLEEPMMVPVEKCDSEAKKRSPAISKESFDILLNMPYGPRGQHMRDQCLTWDDGRIFCGCCGGKSISVKSIVPHIAGPFHRAKMQLKSAEDVERQRLMSAVEADLQSLEGADDIERQGLLDGAKMEEQTTEHSEGKKRKKQKVAITQRIFERTLNNPYGPKTSHTGEIFQGEHMRDQFLTWEDGFIYCGCCGGKSISTEKKNIVQHITGSAHRKKLELKNAEEAEKQRIENLEFSQRDFDRMLNKPYGPRKNTYTGEILRGEHMRDQYLSWKNGLAYCKCCGGKSISKRNIVGHITGPSHRKKLEQKNAEEAERLKNAEVAKVRMMLCAVMEEDQAVEEGGSEGKKQNVAISQEDFEIMLNKPYGPRKNAHTGEVFQGDHRRDHFLIWENGRLYCGCCGGKSVNMKNIVQHITGHSHRKKLEQKNADDAER